MFNNNKEKLSRYLFIFIYLPLTFSVIVILKWILLFEVFYIIRCICDLYSNGTWVVPLVADHRLSLSDSQNHTYYKCFNHLHRTQNKEIT